MWVLKKKRKNIVRVGVDKKKLEYANLAQCASRPVGEQIANKFKQKKSTFRHETKLFKKKKNHLQYNSNNKANKEGNF